MLKAVEKWLVVVLLCAAAGLARAADPVSWNGLTVPVEFTAGSGSNTAMCVLDFAGTGNNVRYAFLYQFDGISKSYDMLAALDAASENFVLSSYVDPSWGTFITGISYKGYSMIDDSYQTGDPRLGSWWDGYDSYMGWFYNAGTDSWYQEEVSAEAPDNIFTECKQGSTSRDLADGYVDGWSQEITTEDYTISNTPQFPSVAPEPASMVLLGIAAVGILSRKRKYSGQI